MNQDNCVRVFTNLTIPKQVHAVRFWWADFWCIGSALTDHDAKKHLKSLLYLSPTFFVTLPSVFNCICAHGNKNLWINLFFLASIFPPLTVTLLKCMQSKLKINWLATSVRGFRYQLVGMLRIFAITFQTIKLKVDLRL